MSPADFHKNTVPVGESFDYFGVKFSYELLDQRLSDLCEIQRFPLYIHLSDRTAGMVYNIFTQLVDETQHGQNRLAHQAYQQALVEQLFILALREIPPEATPHTSPFINRTLGYLYSHFCEPITVSDAAAYVGYTPNYFSNKFKKETGRTFKHYIADLQFSLAENMLRHTDLSVSEICYHCGFGDFSNFMTYFKRRHGIPPKEYRRLAAPSGER